MTNSLQQKISDLQTSITTTLVANGVLDSNPVAVLGALLTFLDQFKDLAGAEEERCAALYLLAETCAKVSRPILKAKRETLLVLCLQVLDMDMDATTTVRYCIRCIDKVFHSLDAATWLDPLVKAAIDALVAVCLDDRAHVRKAALHALRHVVANPPPPQQVHPIAKHVGTATGKLLQDLLSADPVDHATVSHVLTLLHRIVVFLPDSVVEPLVDVLFRIPSLNVPDLTRVVFQVYLGVAARPPAFTHWAGAKLSAFLDALVSIKPHFDDKVLAGPWISATAAALESLSRASPSLCAARFHPLLAQHLFPTLQSSHRAVLDSAAKVITRLVDTCIPAAMVDAALATVAANPGVPASQRETRADLEAIIITCELGLSVRYKQAWPYVLGILSSLVRRLAQSAAVLMRNTIELLGDFRDEPEFTHKQASTQCRQHGVKVRTYLLPLMVDNVQRTDLGFFVEYFVPLAQYLQARKDKYVADEKEVEAKVHEALYGQIWSLLPGFCTYPTDLKEVFGKVGPMVGEMLRQEPTLRPVLCTALHNLIAKNRQTDAKVLLPETLARIGYTPEVAATNVRGVAVSAKFFLPLLFNLYKEMEPHTRGYLHALIAEFVEIADLNVLSTLYTQIMQSLQQAANLAPPFKTRCWIWPWRCFRGLSSAHQKKCYKMLTKMLAMDNGLAVLQSKVDVLERQVIADASLKTDLGAKKYRLQFLCAAVDKLAMESVKEVNHVSRALANELVVKLANRMLEDDAGDEGMDTDDHGIERFIKLVAAGLVGTSPHFVSATILVLARVCFEFRDLVSDELVSSMLASILLLVQLDNREVSKSVFKFIKATVSVFPSETTVRPHLPAIVQCILHLGDTYGSEFKVSGHKRLVANIRKRTERAKRRREEAGGDDADDNEGSEAEGHASKGKSYDAAFESIVYGDSSDSELDEEAAAAPAKNAGPSSKAGRKLQQKLAKDLYIQEDEEDVMDFLDRKVVSHVLASKPRATKAKQDERRAKLASEFTLDKDGKLVIGADNDNDQHRATRRAAEPTGNPAAYDYYMQAIQSTEGFTRTGRKIKFDHAQTQAARNKAEFSDAEDDGDADNDDEQGPSTTGLGLEYRSKKAGGDVKRKGMPDPYAYIPLSAKIVGNRHKSVRLTGTLAAGAGAEKTVRKTIGHRIKKHKK
ncbi:hypothetical protein BCR44DRAFT_1496334 [Catenaria anguillulae PL171]|uniref:Uncharacterized protein n=1 Tax=Catenaria anguillulae PL171 TaxID=765915 RepID=A0A1Y2HXL9_9FUNG|nr:hypothetical protein BCR44DRAFT_1496334 [Catenaria anguillulae PL171]